MVSESPIKHWVDRVQIKPHLVDTSWQPKKQCSGGQDSVDRGNLSTLMLRPGSRASGTVRFYADPFHSITQNGLFFPSKLKAYMLVLEFQSAQGLLVSLKFKICSQFQIKPKSIQTCDSKGLAGAAIATVVTAANPRCCSCTCPLLHPKYTLHRYKKGIQIKIEMIC